MLLVEAYERGKGTCFVGRAGTRQDAYMVVRQDAVTRYGSAIEGVYSYQTPRYDGCLMSYRVIGREVWYNVYDSGVME